MITEAELTIVLRAGLAALLGFVIGWERNVFGAQVRARAVALSLVYPEDDPRLEGELMLLRESLPGEVKLLVGGRANFILT